MVKYELTPWLRVRVEKVTIAQVIKKFPRFTKPDDSLPSAQEPHPKTDEFKEHSHNLFL
jgi:hypothetical protein